ncbi:DUF1735 and LamG domain-containing protein [Prevotella sp.]|uniref:DUF1735 and LamG domain-containing protein n=1 Tax=Prevotella sp. TaxID=59823 RepID=UPI002F924BB1
MQLHKNTFAMALAGLAMMSFSACNDAEYSPLENQAFFAETKTNANIAQKITVEDKDFTPATFHVQLSSPAEGETKFAIEFDEAALKKYNEDNFTNYKLLPTTNYEMPTKEVTFQDGETLSGDIVVNVKPFTQEQKDNADKFALPLKLVSKDGKKAILNSGGAMMLLFDKVVRQAVPTYSARCPFQFKMKEDFNATQWTVEFCVNIDNLGEKVGEKNNQQLLCGWGDNDGEIFSRFGDAPIEGNRMNIKAQGGQLNSSTQFAPNKWYHVAIVSNGTSLSLYVNGVLDKTEAVSGKPVNIKADNWWFGNHDGERYQYLKANVKVSELRIWTKALSQPQIANNMYGADKSADGLYAYFKLNEGSGNDFKDARENSGNVGAKASFGENPVQWEQDVRIDGK